MLEDTADRNRIWQDAVAVADRAAADAGVRMREMDTLADLAAVQRLFDEIWQPDPANPPVTTDLLRAMAEAGNYLAGAFDADGLVGACFGFFAAPSGRAMHSHIAGVAAGMRGHHVGFALKTHQRAWALQRGISEITWTFDPLVRRNAAFNLVRLGATVVRYLPNFYGQMRDGINGSDETDRLLVRWTLDGEHARTACTTGLAVIDGAALAAGGAAVALGVSVDGAPVATGRHGDLTLVAIPADIEGLRGADPTLAGAWRIAVRDALGGALAGGARVIAFDRVGRYLIRESG